jgi:hypothetical protein
LEEEKNGQHGSSMVSREIGRWRKEKAVIKEVRQKESMVEAGQFTIGNRSRVNFNKLFDSFESPFLFLVFLSLDASKQCRNRLVFGFVLKT